MQRSAANASGTHLPKDRYDIVVALSQLSKGISQAEGDAAFAVASEMATPLLGVSSVLVFVKRSGGELAAAVGPDSRGGKEVTAAARAIAEHCLTSASPVVFPDPSFKALDLSDKLSSAGMAAAMGVPMRVGQSNVGAIVALSADPRSFSVSDIEILHVVASQAALAAWRSDTESAFAGVPAEPRNDLIRLAQRQVQELSLINQVSEAVNATLDLDRLLDIVLEQGMTAVEADAGSLMLVNEETNRLEIVASRGLERRLVESTSQEVGKSIAGWVAEHGESVLVSDAHRDSRFSMTRFRDHITSAASVPLKTKGAITGVLNVNTIRPDKVFDERDLEILGTVANQMAVAIENARLYARVNRRTKQLGSLLQISKTVTSTLNLDEVLRRLSYEICKLFQLDVCVLLLCDELSGRLRFGYGSGLKTRRRYAYYDLAAPLASQVKKTGKRIVLRDVSSSTAFATRIAQSESLKAAMCLPLKNHGRLVGIAAGFAQEEQSFSKPQRDIMTLLGDLAGVAIRNARIYRQKYRIAELLQNRLVPSDIPELDTLDIGHKLLPAREVGGDYYDFITAGPNCIGIVMGDVAGSDVEAAEYTTMGKHVLRAYARGCYSPAEVLTKTNSLVCEDTRAEMFISLFYGVIDLESLKLRFANAGCEPALLHKAGAGTIHSLTADGLLLGIRPGIVYEEREVDLEPGDILTLYTDGLTEAGIDNRRFGRQAAAEVVAASSHLSAQQIADRIHDALVEFVHGRISDDVAIVVLKVR